MRCSCYVTLARQCGHFIVSCSVYRESLSTLYLNPVQYSCYQHNNCIAALFWPQLAIVAINAFIIHSQFLGSVADMGQGHSKLTQNSRVLNFLERKNHVKTSIKFIGPCKILQLYSKQSFQSWTLDVWPSELNWIIFAMLCRYTVSPPIAYF